MKIVVGLYTLYGNIEKIQTVEVCTVTAGSNKIIDSNLENYYNILILFDYILKC